MAMTREKLRGIGSDKEAQASARSVEFLEQAERWLQSFAAALSLPDWSAAAAHFDEHGSWRDVVAFSWDIRSFSGRMRIARGLAEYMRENPPGELRVLPRVAPKLVTRGSREVLEFLICFTTQTGTGEGVVRLINSADGEQRAWTLMTGLRSLNGYAEAIGPNRPKDSNFAASFGGPNWLDSRSTERLYSASDPAVLIVGGGQAGLSLAARLKIHGIDSLVVERNPRIGDNWRNRYHSLKLHNEVWANHLPYVPFPDTWPVYIPKDKLANWFEAYVDAMEINAWTGTEFLEGDYDAQQAHWSAMVREADGTLRELKPRHLVLATGISGSPRIPSINGIENFVGEVVHSSEFQGSARYRGRRAVVFGAGNSGHDIAQDLYSSGCAVTMVQRGSMTVASIEPSSILLYELYKQGLPTEDCDLINIANPYPAALEVHRAMANRIRDLDRDLIAGLNDAGFQTDYGQDGTGFPLKYLRTGGGYYLNVGCSDLIIQREIELRQFTEVAKVLRDGIVFHDGENRSADLIVLATGYKGPAAELERMFGFEVADAVGAVWGLDDEGELRNLWKRTAQPGLWFHAGGFSHCRIFSQYLALQIKACELGLIEPSRKPSSSLSRSPSC
jgi:cation diffusion facilitator CzcD-associated flavoprotein CzcO